MISRTQTAVRSGIRLLAVALMFELTGLPITCAPLNRQRSLSAEVKERLRIAATVSLELEPLADISGSEKLLRRSHVNRYSAARPWANPSGVWSCDSLFPDWPTETHAPALRAMLADRDPKLRGMAVEALATLRLPEDVPRFARLLADKSPAAPYALRNGRSSFAPEELAASPTNPDPSSQMYSWYPATVSTYAWRAIWIVTEKSLDAKTFSRWWAVNKDYQNHLWYWNMRIRRAVRSIEHGVNKELYPLTEMAADERKRLKDSVAARGRMRFEQLQKRIADEVMLLEPETAAKIFLLAITCGNLGEDPYFETLPQVPLTTQRLLELVDGHRLWPDVEWEAEDSGDYSRMVHQIMLASPPVFGPEHAAQLQVIFARQKGKIAEGAIFVGISRLLPAAQGDFNTATREGYLRAAIEGRADLFARNKAAAELARVDLPRQWGYLKSVLFSQAQGPGYPDLTQTIIRALGECPITIVKREALLDLLREPGIQPLLTQQEERYRFYLGWTIREHLAQETTAPQNEFSSASGNPLDALPGIIMRLEAKAKVGPSVEKCK